jgi:TonB family protein
MTVVAQETPRLLLQPIDERVRQRRREATMASVIVHLCVVLLIAWQPNWIRALTAPARQADLKERRTVFLYLPPDLPKLDEAPKTPILSDKNRIASGPALKVDPRALRIPELRGESKIPEIRTPPGSPEASREGLPSAPEPSRKGSQEPQLSARLENVPGLEAAPGTGKLPLPLSSPGKILEESMRGSAPGRGSGLSGGSASPYSYDNPNSEFNAPGPVILTDTQGVDFGPYLSRILFTVRRNWYAVIPESARLGQKGKVVIRFHILRDGSVPPPEPLLFSSSGADPLDRAALSAIHASSPFPPLPEAFAGPYILLQFTFLYNLPLDYAQ